MIVKQNSFLLARVTAIWRGASLKIHLASLSGIPEGGVAFISHIKLVEIYTQITLWPLAQVERNQKCAPWLFISDYVPKGKSLRSTSQLSCVPHLASPVPMNALQTNPQQTKKPRFDFPSGTLFDRDDFSLPWSIPHLFKFRTEDPENRPALTWPRGYVH